MFDVKSNIMILNFEDLESSSQTLENIFENFKDEIDLNLQTYILEESLLYGNYFTYLLLDKSFKTKNVEKAMKESILIRIDSLIEKYKVIDNEHFVKSIIKPLQDLRKSINHNYYKKEKMYLFFKDLVVIEFCLNNFLNN